MKVLALVLLPLVWSATIEKKDEFNFESLPTESRPRFAMLDDVRILANGLLQLGHGLKDFVQKTKVQISEIFQKLNVFDKSFYDLSEQTNEIREQEEELKVRTSRLQENNEELKNMSNKIYFQIEHLVRDKAQLQDKIVRLEEKLNQITESQPDEQNHKEIATLKVSDPLQLCRSLFCALHPRKPSGGGGGTATTVRGPSFKGGLGSGGPSIPPQL